MKAGNLVRTLLVTGIILLVASAVSQGIQLQDDKATLESRVTALESRIVSLENEIAKMEKRMSNPPVRIIPCK